MPIKFVLISIINAFKFLITVVVSTNIKKNYSFTYKRFDYENSLSSEGKLKVFRLKIHSDALNMK